MSPSWTTSPGETFTAATVPGRSDSTGISIFIDSSRTTVSPAATLSPGATVTVITLATISATMSAVRASRAMAATLHNRADYPQVRRGRSADPHRVPGDGVGGRGTAA